MERIGIDNGSAPIHEEHLRISRVGIGGVLNEYARREVELHEERFAMARAEIVDQLTQQIGLQNVEVLYNV